VNPTNVNMTIDLASLFVEPQQLDGEPVDLRAVMRDAVIEAAAAKLIGSFDHDERYEMRQEVQRARNELVRERLVEEVAAAMSEPVQRTTQWGEKRGEPTTVRELIRLELEAFLSGTHTNRLHDSYDKTPNNLAELIGSIANGVMNRELALAVQKAKATVDEELRKVLADAIASKLAGIKR
jgi:hypothetical protein